MSEGLLVKQQSYGKRMKSPVQLAFVCFFLTCGGPYGIEDAVSAGGAKLTLIFFVVLPFVYSLPQALMTAEMSSMMPEDGGYIIWVQRAFGDFVAWINSFNNLLCCVADNALYPVIMVSYLPTYFDITYWQSWGIMLACVLLAFILNVYGIEMIGWVSTVLTLLIFLPVCILFVWEAKQIDPATQWTQTVETVDWGTFLGVTLWIYSGWDSAGTIAGEVENVHIVYPISVVLCLFMQSAAYILPVIWGLSYNQDLTNWVNGYFGTLADETNFGMGVLVTVAAMVGNFGVYLAEILCTSHMIWAMAAPQRRKQLPAVFAQRSARFHTPVVALLFQTVATCVLMSFEFELLVQAVVLFKSVGYILEFGAFLLLRYRLPHEPRPYKVSGGWFGAIFITFPMLAIVGFTFALCDLEPLIFVSGMNVVFVLSYVVRRRFYEADSAPPLLFGAVSYVGSPQLAQSTPSVGPSETPSLPGYHTFENEP